MSEAKTDRGRNIQHDAQGNVVKPPWNYVRPANMTRNADGSLRIGRRYQRGRYWKKGKIVGNIRYKEISPTGEHITRPRKSSHAKRATR